MPESYEIPELPTNPLVLDKTSPNYSPYKDPLSHFYGMDEHFIPTPENPLQRPFCQFITKQGEICSQRAVMGTGYAGLKPLCPAHGGNSNGVKDKARDIVEAAKIVLTSSVPSALDKLVYLATDSGVQQNVQLSAIKEILDRSGVKGDNTQKIEIEVTQSSEERIFDKLNELRPTAEAEVLEDLGEQG